MKKIRKLRSKIYDKVIEVQVPVRFYWDKDGYDGFDFGSLHECSKYQLRLLKEVIDQLEYEHDCNMLATYMRKNHQREWQELLLRVEAETSGIPEVFLDAFVDDSM